MEFPIQGYLFKKEQVKIPGGYILKKWNIHGFWFLTMKFRRGVTEFSRILLIQVLQLCFCFYHYCHGKCLFSYFSTTHFIKNYQNIYALCKESHLSNFVIRLSDISATYNSLLMNEVAEKTNLPLLSSY